MTGYSLSAMGVCCALGKDKMSVWESASQGDRTGMVLRADLLIDAQPVRVGQVADPLPILSEWPSELRSRNNQLALLAFEQIRDEVEGARERFGAGRVGVVIGTSTSGIAEGEQALRHYQQKGSMPPDYHYSKQEMMAPADFIARLACVTGPSYVISTACSSSARALMSARTLLQADLVDAVIVGGVDSLCQLTLNGFKALESISADLCQPFSLNRDGINIGEGAALFLMTKESGDSVRLFGTGAASDAHHMSAPHPQGRGARKAIEQACRQAELQPGDLDYINLHGTATRLNDSMESHVLNELSAMAVPASSTKGMTGHTLGAAGAIEAALCWLTLSDLNTGDQLLPHCWDNQPDPELAPLAFVEKGQCRPVSRCLSNSFAFGGNNLALIFGRDR
ncbi:beta-ketoacyl-[acyl-carrier-protein] synthase family protein [Nitrincola sp. MINF-07-Sa-05]|uniref:beta-ketoacyl-[acyl-carrier-protein] synthase family protein n=1 Tax=Nitrincola salilacus TaxID=3400273 RepID=UPI0039184263